MASKIHQTPEIEKLLKEVEETKSRLDEAYVTTRISISNFSNALEEAAKTTNIALEKTGRYFRGEK